jgi:hypothetical protein
MRFTGDNNSAVKEINSCHTTSAVYYEDFTADDHLIHEKIITQNFSINDEAGYNTTQHTLQATPTADYERHENGGGDYAKSQNMR